MNQAIDYDVIIAGGGPVGMLLAYELGLGGAKVLLIEREMDSRSLWKTKPLGMRGLNVSSSEVFYRRGLLNEVLHDDEPAPKIEGESRFAGHFAGKTIDRDNVDYSKFKYTLFGPSFTGGRTYIERIETLLSSRAENLGVEIQRGSEVIRFNEHRDSIDVQTTKGTYRARWLVGCDGGRSAIRKQAGFEFVGTEAELTGYVALCEFADPEKIKGGFNITPTGLYVSMGPGHVGIFDFDNASFDRSQPVSLEHLQSVLRGVTNTDVTINKLHLASTFTDRAKQTTTYKKGRILLAGDSAHIHSPLGGQGMNTGIGDAINLGWKLALVVKGVAPESLLDTYTSERHPAGAWALEWTRAQVAIMRPDPHAKALRTLIHDLIETRDGATHFVRQFLGVSKRYDLGDEHELVGRSAPDFEFEDGTRLGSQLHSGRGLLLQFGSANETFLRGWSDRVDLVSKSAKETFGLQALLIRPDGIVAWVAEGASDEDKLREVLGRWFGPASLS